MRVLVLFFGHRFHSFVHYFLLRYIAACCCCCTGRVGCGAKSQLLCGLAVGQLSLSFLWYSMICGLPAMAFAPICLGETAIFKFVIE